MNTRIKLSALLAAGALLGASPALALDGKVVLDQLVKKGVLTAAEADAIVKADAEKPAPAELAGVKTKQSETTRFTLGALVQVQGKYFTRDDHTGDSDVGQTDSSGFEVRRLDLITEAEIGRNFAAFGTIEMTAGNGGGTKAGSSGYIIVIDKAGVKYTDADAGTFCAALQKTKFGLEEYTPATSLYTIERSVASNYFAGSEPGTSNIGLGGRHIGLFWESKDNSKDGGPRFGAGIANAYQGAYNNITTPASQSYDPAFYANADHILVLNATSRLQLGVNLAYTEDDIDQTAVSAAADNDTRTAGVEFTAKFTTGRLTLIGDAMSAYIENGRTRGGANEGTMPLGATFTVAYKLTDTIEPLAQFGYVDSDGRGITDGAFRDDPLNGNDASPTAGTGPTTYDRACTLFLGAGWYITPKSLKLTAGLDCARFEGATSTAAKQQADIIGGRVQLSALF